ncbi:MAG: urea ABC transporter permease subunit UrtC [Myxococcales bacterium]|nr:urea ABC transporter permease subunit UrtC [Myxococcales bacterium]MDD9969412.1 urea ABC transporter permease subunit UrtC [Myxococcales bacterium]
MQAVRKRLFEIHSPLQWLAFAAIAVLLLVAVPALNTSVATDSALHLPDYLVPLLGKFLCFMLVAIAMDLVWGYTGILSLGHAVFFATGGYAMGMYLMRSIGTQGVYRSELPDFMVFLDWKELPWFWRPFDDFGVAMAAAILVPGIMAFVFGFLAFRSRIKGVYFSIITQAMTYALMLLMFRNNTGFGGNNGLTDFKTILGWSLQDQAVKVNLYTAAAGALLVGYLLCRYVVTSKLGRVLMAVRDQESRVMFAGYDPVAFKLFAWTISAMLCGLAGALYVPQVGIINPSELAPANSIEIAIWVAVGGRGTLVGAAVGALLVNGFKSYLTAAYPDLWLFFLGGLFVLVTLLVPQGLLSLLGRLPRLVRRRGNHETQDPSHEVAREAP